MAVPFSQDMTAPSVAIIDYGLGNTRSVANALEAIGANVCISNDTDMMEKADALILPGVGAFEDGMRNLRNLGLVDSLHRLVIDQKKPFMGICLGMQLITQKSHENGVHEGLGWIDAEVVRFPADINVQGSLMKVPHVGWNDVKFTQENALGIPVGTLQSFYFVHSYFLKCRNESDSVGVCDYGLHFTAVLERDNIFAAQFHPEKSQKHGLELLRRFLQHAQGSYSDEVTHA